MTDNWLLERLRRSRFTPDTPAPTEEEDDDLALDEFETDNGDDKEEDSPGLLPTLPSPNESLRDPVHADVVAPSSITLKSDAFRSGKEWTRTFVIESFPGEAKAGMLEKLVAASGQQVDISLHIDPSRGNKSATTYLKKKIRELKLAVSEKEETSAASLLESRESLSKHKNVYRRLLSDKDGIVDVSLYITIRTDSEDDLRDAEDRVRSRLDNRFTLKTADYEQQDGLVSVSPLAQNEINRGATMLGSAAGALYPFGSDNLIQESGVMIGYHAGNLSPIAVDRYALTAYNALFLGEIGAGKSFLTKLLTMRKMAKDDDLIVFVVDPMGEFIDLCDTVDGKHIPVDGSKSLNPLEIKALSAEALEALAKENHDPYRQTKSGGLDFFNRFHIMQSGDDNTGLSAAKRALVELALSIAYARNGITRDPATHGNESPTPLDVCYIFDEIAYDPLPFLILDETDAEITPALLERFNLKTPIIAPSSVEELFGEGEAEAEADAGTDAASETAGQSPTTDGVAANGGPAPTAPPTPASPQAITSLAGIGSTYGERLENGGLTTVTDLAGAKPETVAAIADTTSTVATSWVEAAREEVAVSVDGGEDPQRQSAVGTRYGGTTTRSTWRERAPVDLNAFTIPEKKFERWENLAVDLQTVYRQFKPGHYYEHLAQPTDITFEGSRFIYLNMEQNESDREIGLMMRLLLKHIDDFAKQTDKKVILALDEAHMLLEDNESIEWLKKRVRHSRHFGLSIQLMTQSAGDLLTEKAAKVITENTQLKVLHRLDLDEEQIKYLELSDSEVDYVKSATMGNAGKGHSTALLDVQGHGRYPLRVEAFPDEKELIDSEDRGG
jgi:predicted flap endonuclease-1-like 5' DNA nuclease